MSIIALQNPLPLLVSSGTLTASQNLQLNQANVLGYASLVGNIFSSVAPAAGFPKITFSADGVTADYTVTLSQDLSKGNFNYTVNVPVGLPYVSVQVKDAGAGSTVRAAVYAYPFSSTSNVSVSVPSPSTTPTYHAPFNGLAAPGGQFFELVGAAGIVLRIRDIFLFKPSVNVEVKGIMQSVSSTGGTQTSLITLLDQNSPAATGVVKEYTVAPVAGTTVGNLFDVKPLTAGDTLGFTFGDTIDEPIVIRSGQSFAMSTDVAATIYGYVKWTESAS